MAMPGQIKTKIDLLKKKIETQGQSASAERQRQLRKRLKRLQRAHRLAVAAELKAKPREKIAPDAETPPAPTT